MRDNIHAYCLLLVCLLLSAWIPPVAYGQEYRDVTEGDAVHLPEDLFYQKDHRIQWWYATGHLFDETGREFGYELTFFTAGIQKRKYLSRFGLNTIYISHFAISDVMKKTFYYADDADAGAFGFAGAKEDRLLVWVGDDSLEGTSEKMNLIAKAENIRISLSLVREKPFVFHGVDGYSRKSEESPLISSLYFSSTSLATKGLLQIGDTVFHVTGKSWFDREISSRGLGDNYQGWDWFALQLDDDREVMLYLIRKTDGSADPFSSGTVVYSDGTYRHLAKDDFAVTALGQYRSKKTGARYPSKWEIVIPSEEVRLTITPLIEDQEFIGTYSTWNYYWEGTCAIEGSITGRAYVEMTGY
jgi:predicted secreted hydrolase